MKYFLFLTFIFISISCNIYSQTNGKFKFDHITVDDGLSQNTVERFYQDSHGFIWIATHDGLNKYDGNKFIKYKFDREDTNSLASNWVSSIIEDSEGNIWIGSLEGLNLYNPKTNKIARISAEKYSPIGATGKRVYDLEVDKDNTVWIGTGNGLVSYIPETKKYNIYQIDQTESNSNVIFDVLITANDNLYIAVEDDPIYLFDKQQKKFTRIEYKQKYFGANFKKNLTEIGENNIYIASEGGALHIYNSLDKSIKFFDVGPKSLSNNRINTAPELTTDGKIWIGTDGGGINIYDTIDNSFSYLNFDSQNPNSISGGGIFDIFEDFDGNIWIGHFGTGISLWKKYKEKFTAYVPNPFDSLSITNGVVTSSYEDRQGRIWLGLDGGGLEQFKSNTSSFKHYKHNPNDPKSLAGNILICIAEDNFGNLLLGTYQQGVMVFDPESEHMIGQFTVENGLSSNNIWDIHKGRDGKYYFASLGMGIDIFDPADSSFAYLSVTDSVNPFFATVPIYITEDNQGNFWFGSEGGGMAMYDLKNDTSIVFKLKPNDLNSLSNNDVKCIVFLDQYAWIATNGGGLNRLDLRDYSFKTYTTKDGLSSDALMGILVDKNNMLWISSVYGLMRFDPKTESFTTFDKAQGLQGNEFRYNSQSILSTGEMIFGGLNGINVFSPENIKPSPIQARVVFTDLKIMNKSVSVQDKNSVIHQHINYARKIKLKHKHRVLTLEFSSLDYTSPEKNQYKYMLKGFDKKWIESGNQNYVTYTSLNPGSYTFRLKGSNSDGIFTNEERSIDIRVLPAWYASKIFIVFVLLLAIYLAYYFLKLREDKTKKDKSILQKKISENQEELEKKIKEIENQKTEIRLRDEQESEMRFLTEGLAKFGDIITKHRKDLSKLSVELVTELVKYIDGNAGIIYLAEEDQNKKITLRPNGEFCFDTDLEKNEFEPGEGYIGTCFNEKKKIVLDNIPESYFVLRSGLGSISLKYSILAPIISDNICMGVMEIASLNKLADYKINFIERLSETYASVVAVNNINEGNKKVLEENKNQAYELLAQEEAMRQNLEELQAIQEIAKKREESLELEIESKDKEISDLRKRLAEFERKRK